MHFNKPVAATAVCLLLLLGAIWIACGSDDPGGPGAPPDDPPACTVRPDTVDFGFVAVGTTVQRTLEIENTGAGTLSGSVALSTSAPCDTFTIVSGGGSFSLDAEEIHTIIAEVSPGSMGEKRCRITTGSGLCDEFVLRASVQPPVACGTTPDSIDFGTLAVQQDRDTSFTISNTGGGVLTGSVTESCDNLTILSGGGNYSLTAGQTRVVTVRVRPVSSGALTCAVKLGNGLCSDVVITGVTEFPDFVGTVVGHAGMILRTTDGGETWQRQTAGNAEVLTGVSLTDLNTGTVVGRNGTILRTVDGGATWTPQSSGTSEFLGAVWFTDANTGTIVGRNGKILRTTDGGDNWAAQTSGTGEHFSSVFFVDANIGTVVGWNGAVLRTTDGGAVWNPQVSGTQQFFSTVWLADALTGVAVTSGAASFPTTGQILWTNNGGDSWEVRKAEQGAFYNSATMIDASTAVVVSNTGEIYRTTDAGATWDFQVSGVSLLNDVEFINTSIGIAVGDGGDIIQTVDGGVTWVPRPSGTLALLRGVSLVSF